MFPVLLRILVLNKVLASDTHRALINSGRFLPAIWRPSLRKLKLVTICHTSSGITVAIWLRSSTRRSDPSGFVDSVTLYAITLDSRFFLSLNSPIILSEEDESVFVLKLFSILLTFSFKWTIFFLRALYFPRKIELSQL